jgi:putative Mg2+ transporter-C (MgtC) family protein
VGFWASVWDGIRGAFADPADVSGVARAVTRPVIAAVLGGAVGWQRQRIGKPAGLRTHMLVSLGAALFIVEARHVGMDDTAVSRIIQGLTAGMGFIGAGAILKHGEHHIEGLTSAAGLWVAAGIGTGVGLGSVWAATATAGLALLILGTLERFEWGNPRAETNGPGSP